MCSAERASAVMSIAGGVTGVQVLEGPFLKLPLCVSVRDVDAAPQHLLLESFLVVAQGAFGVMASCCPC